MIRMEAALFFVFPLSNKASSMCEQGSKHRLGGVSATPFSAINFRTCAVRVTNQSTYLGIRMK